MAWGSMLEFLFSPLYLNCVSFRMTERLVLLLNFARRMLWNYCFFTVIRMSYRDSMFFCVTCQIGEFCELHYPWIIQALGLVEEHTPSFICKSEGQNKHRHQACASQNLLVSFVTLKSLLG